MKERKMRIVSSCEQKRIKFGDCTCTGQPTAKQGPSQRQVGGGRSEQVLPCCAILKAKIKVSWLCLPLQGEVHGRLTAGWKFNLALLKECLEC